MDRYAALHVAGALAVAPDGLLYVVDQQTQQVLVRLGGRFRVVAGDGRKGFTGDDGAATQAELSDVTDIAFAPDDDLYIVDGGRIRVVDTSGMIHTVAGNGRAVKILSTTGPVPVASGTPALDAALGSAQQTERGAIRLSIALTPTGQLYLATPSQLLRLTATGQLKSVPAVIRSGPLARIFDGRLAGIGPIAVDSRGDVDVAGVNGWAIWQVIQNGLAHQVGHGATGQARRSGGDTSVLERAPNGDVYGEDGPFLLRIHDDRLVRAFSFSRRLDGEYFWLTYFAFAPNGSLYADEIPGGDGFERKQQLIAKTGNRVSVLWQQS